MLLYLVRLADRCDVDLVAAAKDKMGKNRLKYPAALSRGSSAKYTAYADKETPQVITPSAAPSAHPVRAAQAEGAVASYPWHAVALGAVGAVACVVAAQLLRARLART